MHHKTWTSLRDGVSLALLALLVAGLFALVWSGLPSPRMPGEPAPATVAGGALPPLTYAIHHAETENAVLLQAALDRMGFDLQAVANGYISVPRVVLASLPPDLARLDSMEARKDLFLRLLLPVVLQVNDQISADRQHLLAIRGKVRDGETLTAEEVQWVLALADTYDQPDADLDALATKVDAIPPSLALAQAIEESGWGTSRIARRQNALFGQFGQVDGDWDYRNFTSLSDAVTAYAHNLNTHRAYRGFRKARAHMRKKGDDMDSWALAGTLHRYSERGDDYVESLRSIMEDNNLDQFDAARLNRRVVATVVASNEP